MAPSPSMVRERNLILASLLAAAAAAWALVGWQSRAMGSHAMGLTMGLGAPLFLAVWLAMMVAMMFPSAAPMVLIFARIAAGKKRRGQPFVPVWVFVAGYVAVWGLAGLPVYAVAAGAERLAQHAAWLMAYAARLGGAAVLAAGLYQLSPLKRACLSKCRTPMQFVLTSWHDGTAGAFRMGLEHGLFCLGCCWAMMLLLLVVGVMSLPWMALLALAVYCEKNGPFLTLVGPALALVLVAGGVTLIVFPGMVQQIAL